jgi:hypothetical protein
MTAANRAAIEESLRKRVEESRNWANDHLGHGISGVRFKGRPARLEVIQFLNDDRVEANGVRFRLFFGKDTKQYFTDLDIRFNTSWVMTEGKDDTAPYLAVYVLDENGAGDLLKFFNILDPSQVEGGIALSEWLVSYINRSIKRGEDRKVMIHKQEVEQG